MVNLPFVVAPRRKPEVIEIGTEESGVLKIERKGFITAGERAFVANQEKENGFQAAALVLGRKVAAKYDVALEDAWDGVVSAIGGQDHVLTEAIAEDFFDEVQDLTLAMMHTDQQSKLFQAAAMIAYRVDAEFDFSQLFDIHPDLIDALANHYRQEASGTMKVLNGGEEEATAEQQVEYAEKKSPEGFQKSQT